MQRLTTRPSLTALAGRARPLADAVASRSRRLPWRSPLGYLALTLVYVAITLRLTDPVYRVLGNGIMGCCDAPLQAWAFWWTRYALLDLGRWPFSTNYLFHPLEFGATATTMMLSYNTLLSVPLQLLFGLNAAVNLVVLASFVLSGLTAFALIRHETGSAPAAFAGSLIFAFAPPLFARLAFGHYATMAIWPTPLIALAWLVALRRGSLKAALVAGGLLGFQASINSYQGSYDVVLLAALAVPTLWGFWREPATRRAVALQTLRTAGLALLAFVVVFSPHLVGIAGDLRAGVSARAPLSHSNSFAPDLLAYFTASPLHPDLKAAFAQLNKTTGSSDFVRVVFPGYLAWALGLAALVIAALRRRGTVVSPWALGLATLFVLSLGPLLHVAGQTQFTVSDLSFNVPLPFVLFWQVPLLGQGRVTANVAFSVSLCLAVLAGWALAQLFRSPLFRRLPHPAASWLIAGGLAVGILYEGLATPIVVTVLPISPFYRQIAAEPGAFALLDVPLGWRDGRLGIGNFRTEDAYAATVHQKPLVGGYIPRAPDEYFAFFTSKPELSFLIDPGRPASGPARERGRVREVLAELGVRYVVVHPGPTQQRVGEYLEQVVGLPQVYRDSLLWAYRLGDGAPLQPAAARPQPQPQAQPPPTPQPVAPRPTPAAAPGARYAEAQRLGQPGRGDGQLTEPRGVAVDAQGNVYVVDTGNARVQKFDAAGRFVAGWGSRGTADAEFTEPVAAAVAPDGSVLVLDSAQGWIKRFTPDGRLAGKLGGPGAAFYHPRGLGVDAAGNVYVADTGTGRIVKFGPGGELLERLGEKGSGRGQLAEPTDVAPAADGTFYVADSANSKVVWFDAEWRVKDEWAVARASGVAGPHLALAGAAGVFVSDPEGRRVVRLGAAGGPVEAAGAPLVRPLQLAVDAAGSLYVADAGAHQVVKLSPAP